MTVVLRSSENVDLSLTPPGHGEIHHAAGASSTFTAAGPRRVPSLERIDERSRAALGRVVRRVQRELHQS